MITTHARDLVVDTLSIEQEDRVLTVQFSDPPHNFMTARMQNDLDTLTAAVTDVDAALEELTYALDELDADGVTAVAWAGSVAVVLATQQSDPPGFPAPSLPSELGCRVELSRGSYS
jgi:hypothetical protein